MKNNIKIFKPNEDGSLNNLFVEEGISAGFPSPAGDFEESRISLEKVVVKNKEATFYAKVSGESMKDAGLDDGDILVIDRSEELKNNKIAVCYLNGEFTVKRVKIEKDHIYLIPENKKYDPIKVNKENEFRYIGDELGYTQGIGLSYQVDFQTFRSLLSKIITNNN